MDKKENIHKDHRKRLRNELLQNGFNASEHRVLEYLLFCCHAQKDVNPLAHKLIDKFGSFKNVLEASYSDLIKIPDVGEITAHFLTSLLPVFAYYNHQKSNTLKTRMQTRKDFVDYFNLKILDKEYESLFVIAVNAKYEILDSKIIRSGKENEVEIDYMDIVTFIGNSKAKRVVVMHNHPSGDATPSGSDIKNTKELLKRLNIVGVDLIDHIIVANSGYYSFVENNKIDEFIAELETNPFFIKKDEQN